MSKRLFRRVVHSGANVENPPSHRRDGHGEFPWGNSIFIDGSTVMYRDFRNEFCTRQLPLRDLGDGFIPESQNHPVGTGQLVTARMPPHNQTNQHAQDTTSQIVLHPIERTPNEDEHRQADETGHGKRHDNEPCLEQPTIEQRVFPHDSTSNHSFLPQVYTA